MQPNARQILLVRLNAFLTQQWELEAPRDQGEREKRIGRIGRIDADSALTHPQDFEFRGPVTVIENAA